MKRVEIGSITVDCVTELGSLPVSTALMFANATPELLARGREWLDERFIHPTEDQVYIDFHSFVIRTGGRTILVDTCHGNHKVRRPPVDYANDLNLDYLGNLARMGYRPEEIDIVLCTHLHFDHIGWNTRLENGKWIPTFPNARYLISRKDFEHFEREHRMPGSMEAEAFEDSVLPIVEAGQADLIDTSHVIERDLGHAVWIEGVPGHTPGSVALHAGA
ncbi:MAG TPA: MBL fold metallo-hydrolase, partial [Alphaproteobacteria bacterium]|nr:MBL fold metallo-hydrolase [Alphaproteobacteria bacterium]